jgi:Transposase DDE domain group 1
VISAKAKCNAGPHAPVPRRGTFFGGNVVLRRNGQEPEGIEAETQVRCGPERCAATDRYALRRELAAPHSCIADCRKHIVPARAAGREKWYDPVSAAKNTHPAPTSAPMPIGPPAMTQSRPPLRSVAPAPRETKPWLFPWALRKPGKKSRTSNIGTETRHPLRGACAITLPSKFDPIGGPSYVKAADRHLGLLAALTATVPDARAPARVTHGVGDLMAQRVFAIACGHPDGNDGDRLADDPIHKLLLGRDPSRAGAWRRSRRSRASSTPRPRGCSWP